MSACLLHLWIFCCKCPSAQVLAIEGSCFFGLTRFCGPFAADFETFPVLLVSISDSREVAAPDSILRSRAGPERSACDVYKFPKDISEGYFAADPPMSLPAPSLAAAIFIAKSFGLPLFRVVATGSSGTGVAFLSIPCEIPAGTTFALISCRLAATCAVWGFHACCLSTCSELTPSCCSCSASI